jgi:hypothetical protein
VELVVDFDYDPKPLQHKFNAKRYIEYQNSSIHCKNIPMSAEVAGVNETEVEIPPGGLLTSASEPFGSMVS